MLVSSPSVFLRVWVCVTELAVREPRLVEAGTQPIPVCRHTLITATFAVVVRGHGASTSVGMELLLSLALATGRIKDHCLIKGADGSVFELGWGAVPSGAAGLTRSVNSGDGEGRFIPKKG